MQLQALPQIDLSAHIIADIADATSGRPGETVEKRSIRSLVATDLMLDLAPCGATEVMLAGHTVMFHALMTDSIRITLQGEIDTTRRGTRAGVVAMNHAFHRNLDRLEQYQASRSEASRAWEPEARTPALEPVQTEAAPDTANQEPTPVSQGPTPAAEAPTQTLTQPVAPLTSDGCPLPLEPGAAVVDTEAAGDAGPSEPTIEPAEAAPAEPSANENDPPATNPPGPPQLNRAQRRLLRRGQRAR